MSAMAFILELLCDDSERQDQDPFSCGSGSEDHRTVGMAFGTVAWRTVITPNPQQNGSFHVCSRLGKPVTLVGASTAAARSEPALWERRCNAGRVAKAAPDRRTAAPLTQSEAGMCGALSRRRWDGSPTSNRAEMDQPPRQPQGMT